MTRAKEQKAAYDKAYREANKDRLLARSREWRAQNAEVLKARKRAYYEANKERICAAQRDARKLYPEKFNNSATRAKKSAERRLRHSKFDAETYHAAMVAQDYRCAICGLDLLVISPHRVHADHCHATGAPRGILCGNCNQALGLMNDDVHRLLAAVEYLRSPTLGLI